MAGGELSEKNGDLRTSIPTLIFHENKEKSVVEGEKRRKREKKKRKGEKEKKA